MSSDPRPDINRLSGQLQALLDSVPAVNAAEAIGRAERSAGRHRLNGRVIIVAISLAAVLGIATTVLRQPGSDPTVRSTDVANSPLDARVEEGQIRFVQRVDVVTPSAMRVTWIGSNCGPEQAWVEEAAERIEVIVTLEQTSETCDLRGTQHSQTLDLRDKVGARTIVDRGCELERAANRGDELAEPGTCELVAGGG